MLSMNDLQSQTGSAKAYRAVLSRKEDAAVVRVLHCFSGNSYYLLTLIWALGAVFFTNS
jgi:hypothetical protein